MAISKKAIVYILISSVAFTSMNVLIKQVSRLPAFELVFFRSIGTLTFVFFLLRKNNISPFGSKRPILFVRAFAGLTSLTLYFWALKSIPVGTATSLRYMSPIFAAILSVYILKEKIKPIQWFLFLIAFLGVLIIKGFNLEVNMLGLIAILASALLVGLVFVLIRKIGNSEHYLVIIFYFMFTSFCFSGLVCLFVFEKPIGWEWFFLLSSGVVGFIGQLTMTQALQMEETNAIVPFKYSEIIFTLILGWILFGEQQTILSLTGIGLILLTVTLNTIIKSKSVNPNQSLDSE